MLLNLNRQTRGGGGKKGGGGNEEAPEQLAMDNTFLSWINASPFKKEERKIPSSEPLAHRCCVCVFALLLISDNLPSQQHPPLC